MKKTEGKGKGKGKPAAGKGVSPTGNPPLLAEPPVLVPVKTSGKKAPGSRT
jgi:hypothetical protein